MLKPVTFTPNSNRNLRQGQDQGAEVNTMKLRLILATLSLSLLPLLTSGVVEAQRTRTQSRGTTFLRQPFDAEGMKLSPNFKGHNIADIQAALSRSLTTRKKGEFESTEEYERRLEKIDNKPFYGGLMMNSRLAFVVSKEALRTKYDADNQILDVFIKLERAVEGKTWNFEIFGVTIQAYGDSRTTYEGQNAYGATATVVKRQRSYRNLVFVNNSEIGIERSSSTTLVCDIKADAATARRLKDRLSVVFVSRLAKPYITTGMIELTPTLSSPLAGQFFHNNLVVNLLEIWILDSVTGTVHFKSVIAKEPEEEEEEEIDSPSVIWRNRNDP